MYELVDFGNGKKLEKIGGLLVERPCPAAEFATPRHAVWKDVDARFVLQTGHRGTWEFRNAISGNGPPGDWELPVWFGALKLFPSDFGHLGVFAEQRANWNWIRDLGSHRPAGLQGLRLLNLFAYTGGTTLAAAAAGAAVTHIDSARNMVRRARQNAARCDLDSRPVRWIVEDAKKFVEREARRGNRFDGVILDPPTYGHGTKAGSTWKIEDDLPPLLAGLSQVVPRCKLLLFTCHTAGLTPSRMTAMARDSFQPQIVPESGTLDLQTGDGRRLPSGNFVRWFQDGNDGCNE